MQPNTLESRVSALKLIARDTLRMNLISPRLSKIANLENNIKELTECLNNFQHRTLVINYEITKMDKEHPDYEEDKKEKESVLVELAKAATEHTEQIESLNKTITEQRENIAKIENGETKVSLDELNALTERLTKEAALKQV